MQEAEQNAAIRTYGALLAHATQLVHHHWDTLSQNDVVRQIAAETSGLLDCLTGVFQTNPEERARCHLDALRRLVSELGQSSVGTHHTTLSSSSYDAGR